METTASIITPDHPYFVPETCQYGVDQQSSQPLTFERASQLLSLTQQNDSPAKKDTRSLIAIVAPLNDIFVDGFSASLVEASCWEKPRALSNFLIQRPSILTGLDAIKSEDHIEGDSCQCRWRCPQTSLYGCTNRRHDHRG
jgi:hypothetical protein